MFSSRRLSWPLQRAVAHPSVRSRELAVIAALWLAALVSGLSRPLLPIDETRYVSVAWEMWQSGQWWVSHMNGAPYADKPPLLFWLVCAGWKLFGVSAWWPKLIAPLAALLAFVQLRRIALALGYTQATARRAVIALAAMLPWLLYSGAVMFDVLLTACLLGAIAALIAGEFDARRALKVGIWLGLALLAKGPAALVTFLPIVISAPLWRSQPFGRAGRLRLAAAAALAIALLLAWALPSAALGGRDYAEALLWRQSADRLHDAMAHAHPSWWYLVWLPVLLFPWALWPAAWPRRVPRERQRRLAWIWALSAFGLFSLISGKQLHYLMPMLPAVALIVADTLALEPSEGHFTARGVALAFVLPAAAGLIVALAMPHSLASGLVAPLGALVVLGAAALSYRQRRTTRDTAFIAVALAAGAGTLMALHLMLAPLWVRYDVTAPARQLARLERQGHPLAHVGNYQATFQFAGRLRRPLVELDSAPQALRAWAIQHPHGWLAGRARDLPHAVAEQPQTHRYAYRGGDLLIVPARYWPLTEAGRHPSASEDSP